MPEQLTYLCDHQLHSIETRNTARKIVGRFRATNLRVFGSVLHGTDKEDSDLDLLVNIRNMRQIYLLINSDRAEVIGIRPSSQ